MILVPLRVRRPQQAALGEARRGTAAAHDDLRGRHDLEVLGQRPAAELRGADAHAAEELELLQGPHRRVALLLRHARGQRERPQVGGARGEGGAHLGREDAPAVRAPLGAEPEVLQPAALQQQRQCLRVGEAHEAQGREAPRRCGRKLLPCHSARVERGTQGQQLRVRLEHGNHRLVGGDQVAARQRQVPELREAAARRQDGQADLLQREPVPHAEARQLGAVLRQHPQAPLCRLAPHAGVLVLEVQEGLAAQAQPRHQPLELRRPALGADLEVRSPEAGGGAVPAEHLLRELIEVPADGTDAREASAAPQHVAQGDAPGHVGQPPRRASRGVGKAPSEML
mmetsp:Transcript_4803/g.9959  ORF Transcript_4803/g.9959 Transcript_4803/m.9959 type:complete len:341 (+) Transcript_4803:505-1527(+)